MPGPEPTREPAAPPVGAALLAGRGLGRGVGGRWLWRQLDLDLHAGHRGLLAGPSGSGKSLLLRTLSRLDLPDEGRVFFEGEPVDRLDVPTFRSRVIYVQQTPVLVPGTVAENLALPHRFRAHRETREVDAGALFQELDRSPDFLGKRASRLSGGEAQLVGLVRAMALAPRVLLLDEPTAHLDPPTTAAVEALVRRWVSEGDRAVLWTSHDPAQVSRVVEGPLIRLGEVSHGVPPERDR